MGERQTDPFDGYSLYALLSKLELANEEDDWEWEAELVVWNRVEDEDPLDVTTLPLLFQGEEIQQGPDLLNPRILFAQFREETIDNMVEGLDDFYEYMNGLLKKVSIIHNLWGKVDLVTVWVNGEELIVNKAMIDEGLIKSDNFWDSLEEENLWNTLEMELLNETLEKTRLDKGKRKADIYQTFRMIYQTFGRNLPRK
ncbi:hypothetical protein RHSIM_Rhsim01G0137800 [Rhododendron simsii]|uniref:Uncharacterized protein n=1 Tax=Rhododendron simsii TaxID=118357 RepID=A0A834HJ82_RHOSS|nr:hypothetical protein RHSIM_Rhsim01G0137800 [Rhododendron simsii]